MEIIFIYQRLKIGTTVPFVDYVNLDMVLHYSICSSSMWRIPVVSKQQINNYAIGPKFYMEIVLEELESRLMSEVQKKLKLPTEILPTEI